MSDEDDLRFHVAFALRDAPIPRTKAARSEDWRNAVAAQVVAYLKLANWKFERGEPGSWISVPEAKREP